MGKKTCSSSLAMSYIPNVAYDLRSLIRTASTAVQTIPREVTTSHQRCHFKRPPPSCDFSSILMTLGAEFRSELPVPSSEYIVPVHTLLDRLDCFVVGNGTSIFQKGSTELANSVMMTK